MRKKILITGILVVLLVGLVSASLLSYYGRITGTAEVKGPVFYLGSGGELLINEKPSCGTAGTFDNHEFRVWETEDLGGTDFGYIPTANFYIRARVGEGDEIPQNLILNFSYEDTNNNKHEICSTNVEITSTSLDDYGPISCIGTSAPLNIEKLRYEIIGDCDACTYTISKCSGEFYTKLEVSLAT